MNTQLLDAVIDRALAERRIVGTVLTVLKDGQLAYHRAAGLVDREANVPMREDAIFRFASLTKPIVTTAAMALIERGQLGLDDPITKWLPEFTPKTGDGQTPTILIRQLLTHTAGLSYGFFEKADGAYHRAGVSDGLDMPGLSMKEEIKRLVSAGLFRSPGQKWIYSLGIDVVGAALEAVTGESLQDAVKRLVTDPLNMVDTAFYVSDPNRAVTPYADGKPEPVRMSDPHIVPSEGTAGVSFSPSRIYNAASFPSGGCGMAGTAKDFVTFLEALRQGGTPILEPNTVRAMMSNQSGNLPPDPGWDFGFGGRVLNDPDLAQTPQSVGTWMWGGAYGHSWFVDPAKKLVVLGLTNTTFEGMNGAFPKDVRDAVYSAEKA